MRRLTLAHLAVLLSTVMLTTVLIAAPAYAACSNTTGSNGSSTEVTYDFNGESRTYLLHVPPGLTATAKVPLLLSLHGADTQTTPLQTAKNHRTETEWNKVARSNKFIVAYPVAASLNWRIEQESNDVKFLRNLIGRIPLTRCINPKRIHIEGHSRGGLMAERMACDAENKIASVAAYAGGSPSLASNTPCSVSRGIGVGIFQNTLDLISTLPIGIINRDEWRNRNDCPANGAYESGVFVEAASWKPCKGGSEVVWRLYGGLNGHLWPTAEPDHTDITTRMWALFTRNPLP